MRWLRAHYGKGPLHLAGSILCFVVAGYAATRVLGQSGWSQIFLLFLGCTLLHDFVAWPAYAAADRLLTRRTRRRTVPASPGARAWVRPVVPWVNHVRFPAVISGVLLAMFFPLILRISNRSYQDFVGYNEDVYLVNWLVVTAVVSACSTLAYLARLGLARRRARGVAKARGPKGNLALTVVPNRSISTNPQDR